MGKKIYLLFTSQNLGSLSLFKISRCWENKKNNADFLSQTWEVICKFSFHFPIWKKCFPLGYGEMANKPKNDYKMKILKLFIKAAFVYMSKEQNGLSENKVINYESLKIQDFLRSQKFNPNKINHLTAFRSRSHPARLNHIKMNFSNIMCSLGCQKDKDHFNFLLLKTAVIQIQIKNK